MEKIAEGVRTWWKESLHLLFLLYFQPTNFAREVGGKIKESDHNLLDHLKSILIHHVRFLPFNLIISIIIRCLIATSLIFLSHPSENEIFNLLNPREIISNVISGMVFGTILIAIFGLSGSISFSIACSIIFGVIGGKSFCHFFVFAIPHIRYGDIASCIGGFFGGIGFGGISGRHRNLRAIAYSIANVVSGFLGGISIGIFIHDITIAIEFVIFYLISSFRLHDYFINSLFAMYTCSHKERNSDHYPIFWNELIWLPLPFSRAIMRWQVETDAPAAFRRAIFLLTERPTQRRWMARYAVEEYLKVSLRVNSLAEMAGKDFTFAASLGTNKDVEAALADLSAATNRLNQYAILRSGQQRQKALADARAKLGAAMARLSDSRDVFSRTLLGELRNWDRLLAKEETVLVAQNPSARLANPFVYGNPVDDQHLGVFLGRLDIVAEIEKALLVASSAPTLLLYGPRRMGKTSALIHLPRLLGEDYAACFLDCQSSAVREGLPSFLFYASRAIVEGLGRRRFSVPAPSEEKLKEGPFREFDRFLEAVEASLPEGKRVLLCLDEFERLEEKRASGETWVGDLLDELRHLMQHRPKFVVMFTGAHTFGEMGPAWTDRFISARSIRVGRLTADEARQLVTAPEENFALTYAPGALDALLHATARHPLVTQAVAYELVERLNETGRVEATTDDIDAAIEKALTSAESYFSNLWADAEPDGQEILLARAAGETPPDHHKAEAWLIDREVLETDGQFVVPAVERWVRREKLPQSGLPQSGQRE